MRRSTVIVVVACVLVLGAGCGGSSKSTGSTGSGGSGASALKLKHPGVLTVGAEFPAQGFLNLPRSNPTGFEADVANEIAKRLKIKKVQWLDVPFTSIFSPAPTKFDFDINEITITPQRLKVVDFSVPYFDANQALYVHTGTPIEKAKSIADLKGYLLGGQATTTGLDYIKTTIKPSKKPREYSHTGDAAQAVATKQIDGFVIDVPIAAALKKQYKGTTIVGQFVTNEQYGILFQKGNPLRLKVDEAVSAMKADGTLKRLQDKWFPGTSKLPVLK
jgi:polar amino acid transport system substrate-binding protein